MKKFKNDKERIAFLEDYRNEANGWQLWKQDDDMQRRCYRFDMPDGSALIVEEELVVFRYPKLRLDWNVMNRYHITDWGKPFGDQKASKTMMLSMIKELERAAKW